MVFFCNLLYSLLYTYGIDRRIKNSNISNISYFFLLLHLFLLWIFLCGGQYNVGTDYFSYLNIFNNIKTTGDFYSSNGEFGFVAIIRFCNFIGLKGQSLFYVFYGIGFLFFYLTLKRIKGKNIFIFILLYITITSLFNNQLNMLRQSVAIYIGTYALLLIFEQKNLRGLVFIFFAASIHISSAVFLLGFLHKYLLRIKPVALSAAIGICLMFSFFLTSSSLDIFIQYLPDTYAWHIQNESVSTRTLLQKIPKFIFVPVYLLSLFSYKRYSLNTEERTLFHFGIVAFCFRLLLSNLSIVSRLADSFLLLSIFPLHIYMRYLFYKRHTFLFISISVALLLLYFLKTVVFPVREYLYHSIYV